MSTKDQYLRTIIEDSLGLKKIFFQENLPQIIQLYEWLREAAVHDRQVLIFGNGGSAADAQHFAAELMHRVERKPIRIRALALHTDTSLMTAIANDEGFDFVFSQQLDVLSRSGDVAIAISTSGDSPNVLKALKTARDRGCRTVGLLGKEGGAAAEMCELALVVRHASTPRIQEVHVMVIHAVCQLLEEYDST